MLHILKKLFKPKKKTLETIIEMEQKKHDLEVQLKLLDELEKKLRKQIEDQANN